MKRLMTIFCFIALFVITAKAQQTYYTETFETGGTTWTSIDNDGLLLNTSNPLYSTSRTKMGWEVLALTDGSKCAASTSYYNPAGTSDDWFISSEIAIGEKAFLKWQAVSGDASYPEDYRVLVSTTGSSIADFTNVVATITGESADGFTTHSADLSAYANQTIRIAFQNNSTDKYYMLLDNISIVQPVLNDAAIIGTNIPSFLVAGNSLTLNTYVANLGSTPITSLDLNYQINGGAVQTCSISSLDIKYFGYETITHTSVIDASVAELKNIKIWISNVNLSASADLDYTNDTTTVPCIVFDNSNTHQWPTPLIEEFTSSTCNPCASLNTTFNPLIETNKEGISIIKYQMNWPSTGDPYYNADGGIRRTLYGVSGVPAVYFIGSVSATPVTQTMIDNLKANRSFFDITGTYKVTDKTITVNADIKPFSSMFTNLDVTAFVAVVEIQTTGNKSTNGETAFHYVEQKMLPNANGTVVTAKSADDVQKLTNLSYTFTSTDHVEEMSDLAVVLFLQEKNSKRILASTWATIEGQDVKNDNSGNGIVSLYPNPANETSRVRFQVRDNQNVNIELFDINGQPVLTIDKGNLSAGVYFEDFNAKNLTSGQYIVKVTIGNNSYSTPLNIVK
jgi:hypothetical protein